MWKTLKCLAETEGTIHLLSTLKSRGLATNDIRNFVVKQTVHKKILTDVDARVRNCAMQSKLIDALAHAKRLRQTKNSLKQKILKKYRTKAKGKRIVKGLVDKYRNLKVKEFEAAELKITHLQEKDETEKVVRQTPDALKPLLDGVNLFSESAANLKCEPPTGLKVFDKSLKFTQDELKVLAKGPKFMIRGELDNEEFEIELEKMVVKDKYNEMFKIEDDCAGETSENPEGPNGHQSRQGTHSTWTSERNFRRTWG